MIDLQQLKQLVTISDCGTVSKAAEVLFISQPALSRSMQRMEEDLGVALFDRLKNKIELNENGKLAVEFAKKILNDFDYYMESIKAFDKSKRNIFVGSCAPAPLWELIPELSQLFPDKTVTTAIVENDALIKGLSSGDYHIIITSTQLDSPEYVSVKFKEEHLNICVPHNHKLAAKTEGITFEEMDGISMLLFEQIGTWEKVLKNLPNTRFIVQTDRNTFNDLIRESLLPVFATNLSVKYFGELPNRVVIPILERDATDIFYITVLKKNKHLIKGL
ncbi:MAG: LysR family transcriptional regulator [Clostridia bacterium]|nr:LysR family transcriptional regulator [Clostridia bacterium]